MLVQRLPQEAQETSRGVIRSIADEHSKYLRIVVEYGNSAVPAGSAIGGKSNAQVFTCKAFAQIASITRGSKLATTKSPLMTDASRALSRVEFDINPDFPQAAIKVTAAPFVLERSMAMKYSCNIRLCFAAGVGVPVDPLIIPYSVEHEPMTTRRIVILLSPSSEALQSQDDQRSARDDEKQKKSHRLGKAKPFVVNHDNGIFVRFAMSF